MPRKGPCTTGFPTGPRARWGRGSSRGHRRAPRCRRPGYTRAARRGRHEADSGETSGPAVPPPQCQGSGGDSPNRHVSCSATPRTPEPSPRPVGPRIPRFRGRRKPSGRRQGRVLGPLATPEAMSRKAVHSQAPCGIGRTGLPLRSRTNSGSSWRARTVLVPASAFPSAEDNVCAAVDARGGPCVLLWQGREAVHREDPGRLSHYRLPPFCVRPPNGQPSSPHRTRGLVAPGAAAAASGPRRPVVGVLAGGGCDARRCGRRRGDPGVRPG